MENQICIDLKKRINRIKGQINGIEKMIDTNRTSAEVIQQISAVRSALGQLAVELLKEESQACLQEEDDQRKLASFEELVKSLFKVS